MVLAAMHSAPVRPITARTPQPPALPSPSAAADLTIMEEGTELLARLRRAWGLDQGADSGHSGHSGHAPGPLPMFTSCCPGRGRTRFVCIVHSLHVTCAMYRGGSEPAAGCVSSGMVAQLPFPQRKPTPWPVFPTTPCRTRLDHNGGEELSRAHPAPLDLQIAGTGVG